MNKSWVLFFLFLSPHSGFAIAAHDSKALVLIEASRASKPSCENFEQKVAALLKTETSAQALQQKREFNEGLLLLERYPGTPDAYHELSQLILSLPPGADFPWDSVSGAYACTPVSFYQLVQRVATSAKNSNLTQAQRTRTSRALGAVLKREISRPTSVSSLMVTGATAIALAQAKLLAMSDATYFALLEHEERAETIRSALQEKLSKDPSLAIAWKSELEMLEPLRKRLSQILDRVD